MGGAGGAVGLAPPWAHALRGDGARGGGPEVRLRPLRAEEPFCGGGVPVESQQTVPTPART